ncbi:MAG TPA: arginine--tRNA ligase, partial [Actinomycetes bacterium]
MTPAELSTAVQAAIQAAVDAGDLFVPVPETVKVERPKVREHGDYATSVAMQLAKPAGRPPREVAEAIAARLRQRDGVASVDVAGPGFLNITLDSAAQGELARTIVTAGSDYGRTETLGKQRINLEFVSANPTGPVHIGGVRWAAVGDALSRLLRAAGAT